LKFASVITVKPILIKPKTRAEKGRLVKGREGREHRD